MTQIAPYFKPLHPAVTLFCNLCGVKVEDRTYLTETVRQIEAPPGAQYVFCPDCHKIAGEVSQLIEYERARLFNAASAEIEKTLEEVARAAIAERVPKPSPVGETPSNPGARRPSKPSSPQTRRRGTYIPSAQANT